MKGLGRIAFYMLLSILGLSYLTLLLFIGAQMGMGKVTTAQLVNILRVLDGQVLMTLPSTELEEYEAFKKDRAALQASTAAEFGRPDVLRAGRQELQATESQLRDTLAVTRAELSQAKEDVLTARREVDGLRAQLASERALFASQVAKEAAVQDARAREAYTRIIPAMDAGALGEMLERMAPDEGARMLREYIPGDIAAEIMGDLPVDVRLRLLPLVENPNAGMSPQAAATLFAQRRAIEGTYAMGPLEIYQNLRRMNAAQAMTTRALLPEDLRGEVDRIVRSPPTS